MMTEITSVLATVVIGLNSVGSSVYAPTPSTPTAEINQYMAAQDDLSAQTIALALQEPELTPSPTPVVYKPAATPAPTRVPQPIPAPAELEQWFSTYAGAFGVNPDLLKTIARCESGFNPNSQGGIYGGMFQYSASTWSSTRNAMGLDPDPDLRYNAEEAIKTSAWKISAGGIGAWPHCGRLLASAEASH